MPHYRKLTGEKCYLSPPASDDAERWVAWFNDLEVTLPLGDEAYVPIGLEKAREEVEETIRRQEHVFSIVDRQTEQLIGRCLLFNVDPVNRSAMLGVLIGEKGFWGQGYGQEATRLLLDYAFNLLNLHTVMLGAFAFNERALAAYRKVGFKEIGRRREARALCRHRLHSHQHHRGLAPAGDVGRGQPLHVNGRTVPRGVPGCAGRGHRPGHNAL